MKRKPSQVDDCHPLSCRLLEMDNFATASRSESEPFPQPGLGAYKGTLWDPTAKIAARTNTTVLTATSHWAQWQRPFPAAAVQLKLSVRSHAHMSSSDAEFQRQRS